MYAANRHFPGCLPEGDWYLPVFDTAREAWAYLDNEAQDYAPDGTYWMPDDPDDPDGPQSCTQFALDLQHLIERGMPGSILSPNEGLIYEVDEVEVDMSHEVEDE